MDATSSAIPQSGLVMENTPSSADVSSEANDQGFERRLHNEQIGPEQNANTTQPSSGAEHREDESRVAPATLSAGAACLPGSPSAEATAAATAAEEDAEKLRQQVVSLQRERDAASLSQTANDGTSIIHPSPVGGEVGAESPNAGSPVGSRLSTPGTPDPSMMTPEERTKLKRTLWAAEERLKATQVGLRVSEGEVVSLLQTKEALEVRIQRLSFQLQSQDDRIREDAERQQRTHAANIQLTLEVEALKAKCQSMRHAQVDAMRLADMEQRVRELAMVNEDLQVEVRRLRLLEGRVQVSAESIDRVSAERDELAQRLGAESANVERLCSELQAAAATLDERTNSWNLESQRRDSRIHYLEKINREQRDQLYSVEAQLGTLRRMINTLTEANAELEQRVRTNQHALSTTLPLTVVENDVLKRQMQDLQQSVAEAAQEISEARQRVIEAEERGEQALTDAERAIIEREAVEQRAQATETEAVAQIVKWQDTLRKEKQEAHARLQEFLSKAESARELHHAELRRLDARAQQMAKARDEHIELNEQLREYLSAASAENQNLAARVAALEQEVMAGRDRLASASAAHEVELEGVRAEAIRAAKVMALKERQRMYAAAKERHELEVRLRAAVALSAAMQSQMLSDPDASALLQIRSPVTPQSGGGGMPTSPLTMPTTASISLLPQNQNQSTATGIEESGGSVAGGGARAIKRRTRPGGADGEMTQPLSNGGSSIGTPGGSSSFSNNFASPTTLLTASHVQPSFASGTASPPGALTNVSTTGGSNLPTTSHIDAPHIGARTPPLPLPLRGVRKQSLTMEAAAVPAAGSKFTPLSPAEIATGGVMSPAAPGLQSPLVGGDGSFSGFDVSGLHTLREVYTALCDRRGISPNSSVLKSLPPTASQLTSLDLSRTYMGQRGAQCIVELLTMCPKVSTLNLSDNKLDNPSIQDIAKRLAGHPSLQSISFDRNLFSKAGGRAVLELLEANPRLTSISMEGLPFLQPTLRDRIVAQAAVNAASSTASSAVGAANGESGEGHQTGVHQINQPAALMQHPTQIASVAV